MSMSYLDSVPTSASPAASDDSTNPPRTPVSPPMHSLTLSDPALANSAVQQAAQNQGSTQPKRKPSRRANTAERRATHNAVERQRRETLNGRFLDLAALLPNLSQIRRPSKSSIVNSSIAYVHASRRHRSLAARELRNLKAEYDVLRREVNEWRDRANIPRVEEPIRSDNFAMILSGELEALNSVPEEDDDAAALQYDGYDEHEDDYGTSFAHPAEDIDDPRLCMQNAAMLKNAHPFGHTVAPAPLDISPTQHVPDARPSLVQHQAPIIVSNPSSVSYENPAMSSLFEPQVHPYGAGIFLAQQALESDKIAAWNAQVYAQQQPHVIYNPSPRSSVSDSSALFVDQALFGNCQRQQPQSMTGLPLPTAGMYATDSDDTSSVGSGRGRSESVSGSGFGSPTHLGSPLSYDHPGTQADYLPRKISTVGLGMWRDADGMVGMGMMKPTLGSPINVGGGGNGTGFGVMM